MWFCKKYFKKGFMIFSHFNLNKIMIWNLARKSLFTVLLINNLWKKWKSLSCVRLFVTLIDYTVHGILQSRILEWVAVPFSRGFSQPRDWIQSPALWADSLPGEPPGKSKNIEGQPIPSPGNLPNPGIELGSPALQADSLPAELPGV